MHIQLIRNATMRLTSGGHTFITDPYFAPKHSQEPLIGRSRNPMVDLPFPPEEILAGVEMVLVSHLHPDHFDSLAQQILPKDIQIYCQPSDEGQIKEAGFSNVTSVDESEDWHNVRITRVAGQHGDAVWSPQMGPVSGFIFRAENEPTIYWTGDTIWCEPVKQVVLEVQPNVIITHSSGASFEFRSPIIMDAQQTWEVCRAAPRSVVIAVHMETFDFDTISRKDLRAFAEADGISTSQLIMPGDGETVVF
jgi:L-ascorbate metabolism protein UlaG (beta-lactamase superfamily)